MDTASQPITTKTNGDLPWYQKTKWIIALLILFWPVGLFLMWKYTTWNKVVKGIITAILLVVGIPAFMAVMNPAPMLKIDNTVNGRIATDNAEYNVTGSTGGVTDGVKVLVNDKEALWAGDKFNSIVKLSEGDNQITVKAIKGDQTDEEKIVIHRNTAEEIKARQEAEISAKPEASTSSPKAEEPKASVPAEYRSALNKASTYANTMNMSKAGVYDQLTSEYGEKFSAEAAQYAIDNVKADWNANALAKAKTYQNTMSMSPSAIHDQLTSAYGEKFTAPEADYAIQNLNN